ncbi:MAG: hypothetical protein ACFCVC_11185 [Acidimicrobiia bacterium]
MTGPGGSITLVTPDGGTTVVTERSAPSFSIQPTPSPDGTRIAHTALGEDGAPVMRVWTESTSVDVDFGFSPFFYAWSPDGAFLAALGNDGAGGVAGAIAHLTSGDVTGIGSGAPHFMAWSPDGSRLATHRNGTRIDLVGTDGTATNVPQFPAIFQAPDWLSQEEVLIAVADSGLQASLIDIPAGVSRLRAVTGDGGTRDLIEVEAMSQFDVDPGGLRLAVFDGAPGSGRMRILELESGVINEVDAPRTVAFEWSPDGSRLLTFSLDDDGLLPEVWSANGAAEAAFESFTPTATFVNEYLAFWGQYVRTVRLWSPTGDAFVYPAATPSEEAVFLQRLDAEGPERIVTGSMAQWLP